MKFCSECAAPLIVEVPEGDHRPRHVCPKCSTIHYQNPRIIVGTLPVHQGKIMLCRRGIEPRIDLWTLPGGFMENDESLAEGALRETWEESKARVEIEQLISVISLPIVDQVHCFYLANMPIAEYSTTEESTEIELFAPADIPWQEIAFETVKTTLQHYLDSVQQDLPKPYQVCNTTLGPRKSDTY
ncbi:NUDIX hydrolase [Gynuella sp.]|uniref:NUDIX hydrolase n=1 Tax=Gynuella sp. TaxID=2969146 RepID=UPI003D10BE62